MTTNTPGSSARQLPIQAENTKRFSVNFNDPNIANGVAKVVLPAFSFISSVQVTYVTPFNAGTTNTFTLGTSAGGSNIFNSALDGQAPTVQANNIATRGQGSLLTQAGDTTIFATYTQSGAPASAGVADVLITFEPNMG